MSSEALQKLIEEAAVQSGFLIYESGVLSRGSRSHISVKIDAMKTISHADCETYSRALSELIDKSELLPGYTLEISSPGIERKLRNLDEFRRFTGSRARVNFTVPEGNVSLSGIIVGAESGTVTVEHEKGRTEIEIDSITSSNIEL